MAKNIFPKMTNRISGPEVKQWLKESRVPLGALALKLGMTRQNLSHHLRKKEMDLNLLAKMEEIVKANFTSEEPESIMEKPTTKEDTYTEYEPLAENTARIIAMAKGFSSRLTKIEESVSGHSRKIKEHDDQIFRITKLFGRTERERIAPLEERIGLIEKDLRLLKTKI